MRKVVFNDMEMEGLLYVEICFKLILFGYSK